MLIGLSVSLVVRELILSIIAFFYERAVYAFFKEQVKLERKYIDLKQVLKHTGRKVAIFDQLEDALVF